MQRAIEIYAVITLTVIGFSHALRPRAWVDFFVRLRERGEAGVFATAFLNLFGGALIVAFHNVWRGIPLVLTLLGWAQVLKALIYFTFPRVALKRSQGISHERTKHFVAAGVVCLLLAAMLGYHLWVTR
jgi:hypothetical protein